jgi:hypothetical protein
MNALLKAGWQNSIIIGPRKIVKKLHECCMSLKLHQCPLMNPGFDTAFVQHVIFWLPLFLFIIKINQLLG